MLDWMFFWKFAYSVIRRAHDTSLSPPPFFKVSKSSHRRQHEHVTDYDGHQNVLNSNTFRTVLRHARLHYLIITHSRLRRFLKRFRFTFRAFHQPESVFLGVHLAFQHINVCSSRKLYTSLELLVLFSTSVWFGFHRSLRKVACSHLDSD